MMATFLNELFATVFGTLPRLFLFGAPFLLIGIVLAAFLDTKLPEPDRRAPR